MYILSLGKGCIEESCEELKKAVYEIELNVELRPTDRLSGLSKIKKTGTAVGRGITRKGRTLIEAQIEK